MSYPDIGLLLFKETEEIMMRSNKWQINPSVPRRGAILDRILFARGITSAAARTAFLEGTAADLHNPFELPDMKHACELLLQERAAGRTVIIHGDYDADGITATAVLVKAFAALGIKNIPVLPERMADGYGISPAAVCGLASADRRLLITVDCGIANADEVAFLKGQGLTVIITDHHQCPPILPAADAVINPKRTDCTYPFRELSGAGVAFKLVQALCRLENRAELWLEIIDLVAVGTIADVVPLLGENRILARLGLEKMNDRPCFGLKALLTKISEPIKAVTSRTVGYQIAPRLNAAGRVGRADAALELLLAPNEKEAEKKAEVLCACNQRRIDLEAEVLEQALALLAGQPDLAAQKIVVVAGDDWHQGVLGIIAARLADRYSLPAIVLSLDEAGYYKGSARGPDGFDIYAALNHSAQYLMQFGGHSKAAGLSLAKEQLPEFISEIRNYAARQNHGEQGQIMTADLHLPPAHINLDLAAELGRLEPFGEGNPQPLLVSTGLSLRSIRTVGGGRHIKVSFAGGSRIFDGIGFGMGDLACEYQPGHKADIMYFLEINSWMGKEAVQLNLRDMRKSMAGGAGCDD